MCCRRLMACASLLIAVEANIKSSSGTQVWGCLHVPKETSAVVPDGWQSW